MLQFDDDFTRKFNNPSTIKVLATRNKQGDVHLVFRKLMYITPEKNIKLFEIVENSLTNKNMLFSLWFNREIVVSILLEDSCEYQITLLPERAITCGNEFTRCYAWLQNKIGDYDLSTVWILKPVKIIETSLSSEISKNVIKYPMINHLDRLLKENLNESK